MRVKYGQQGGSWLTDKNTKRQKDEKGQDQKTKWSRQKDEKSQSLSFLSFHMFICSSFCLVICLSFCLFVPFCLDSFHLDPLHLDPFQFHFGLAPQKYGMK